MSLIFLVKVHKGLQEKTLFCGCEIASRDRIIGAADEAADPDAKSATVALPRVSGPLFVPT